MNLPDELRRVAAVGTGQIETLPQTIAAVDAVVGKIEGQAESVVLLKAAGVALRRQAGYIAGKVQRPLDAPCDPEPRKTLNVESIRYLVKMLQDPHYAPVLPEWCIRVVLSEQRVPAELLPEILRYGQRAEHKRLRGYLGLLLGGRGKWLAQQVTSQNWDWALEVDDRDPKALLAAHRSDEYIMMEAFNTRTIDTVNANDSHNQHPGLRKLGSYTTLWSRTLADVFVSALEFANVTANPAPDKTLDKVLERCGYYFPLEDAHNLLNLLSRGGEAWQARVQDLQAVFTMRVEIVEALYQTAEQTA